MRGKVERSKLPSESSPDTEPDCHVPLGSTVPTELAPSSLLKCTSSHPSSRHTPPPGTSYWQIRFDGSRRLLSAIKRRGVKSGLDEDTEEERKGICSVNAAEEEDIREDMRGCVEGYMIDAEEKKESGFRLRSRGYA